MKIIISPAKKMNVNTDLFPIKGMPVFIEEAGYLAAELRKKSYAELKKLWQCNDRLTALNMERVNRMNPCTARTPALFSYEGLQYQHVAPAVLEETDLNYLQKHLRILSGFYGILRPFDGVTPYRLEMQARLITENGRNLYEFWGQKLFDELTVKNRVIINLASKEYSRCIEPYITDEISFITCVFGEYKDGNVIEKGTRAKMARGEMVRWMARQKTNDPVQMKHFSSLDFRYIEDLSLKNKYVFINN